MSLDNIAALCFRTEGCFEMGFSQIAYIDNAESQARRTSLRRSVTKLFYELKAFRSCVRVDSRSDNQ